MLSKWITDTAFSFPRNQQTELPASFLEVLTGHCLDFMAFTFNMLVHGV